MSHMDIILKLVLLAIVLGFLWFCLISPEFFED
jgi:hypothetical protein